jgi:hypothetical protein
MSYFGTTSTSPNPPRCIVPAMGGPLSANSTNMGAGGQLWFYNSSNLTTDLLSAGFFSDGKALGMRNGDVLIAPTYSTQSSTGQILVMGILQLTAAGAADLSTDGTMTSTFS